MVAFCYSAFFLNLQSFIFDKEIVQIKPTCGKGTPVQAVKKKGKSTNNIFMMVGLMQHKLIPDAGRQHAALRLEHLE